ncbi:MAG TPA: MXAN_2562 family outer membrane beta-barrel protein [Polyangiales bacterium]|nr:MXAN_2562 family outer membrane beta-barrel protein [Polyangiales bacterium]
MRRAARACNAWLFIAVAVITASGASSRAHAQGITDTDPMLIPADGKKESIERFILEVRGGTSSPDVTRDTRYGTFFRGDSGPNLGAELDGVVWRQPQLFYLTLGASIGTISFSGHALAVNSDVSVSEKTTLSLVPITGVVGFRFDGLARRFHIPLVLTARGGWEWMHWSTGTGARDDAAGWSVGPVISAQAALDLDSFEPGGARNLDEEWGINHTFVFAEIYRFIPVAKSLALGDTSWLAGLGFIF